MKPFLLAIATALIWGIAPIFEKIGLGKIDPTMGVILRGFGVFACVLMLFLWQIRPTEGNNFLAGFMAMDKRAMFFILLGGIIATFFGQLFFYRALKLGMVSQVVPVAASYPLVTFIIGVIFLGDVVTASKVAGIVLVVAGVFFLS